MNRMFLDAIEREDLSGAFNATGPNPATNAEFMRELRRALHRPWSPPAPVWAVHFGSWLMRTEPSLALTGSPLRAEKIYGGRIQVSISGIARRAGGHLQINFRKKLYASASAMTSAMCLVRTVARCCT